jgi:hypothetical protein
MIKMTLFKVYYADGKTRKHISWDKKTLLDSIEEKIASVEPITDLVGNTYQDIISQGRNYD